MTRNQFTATYPKQTLSIAARDAPVKCDLRRLAKPLLQFAANPLWEVVIVTDRRDACNPSVPMNQPGHGRAFPFRLNDPVNVTINPIKLMRSDAKKAAIKFKFEASLLGRQRRWCRWRCINICHGDEDRCSFLCGWFSPHWSHQAVLGNPGLQVGDLGHSQTDRSRQGTPIRMQAMFPFALTPLLPQLRGILLDLEFRRALTLHFRFLLVDGHVEYAAFSIRDH